MDKEPETRYYAKDAISLKIQKIAAENNLTLHKLAETARVAPSTIYSLTNPDRRDIHINTLEDFLAGMDISFSEFFDDELFRKIPPKNIL